MNWFFAAGMVACIVAARPARGHMLVDDAMDVVISPDGIVVDVRISLDEVGLIEAHGQPVPSPEAWIPLIEAHRDYVLSHLHIKADGVELVAKAVPDGTPPGEVAGDLVDGSDETQMGGYHLEFELKSPPGTIHIEQDFLKEFDPSDANFVTRIRQNDNPEFKIVQINRDAHTDFNCHWMGQAATQPAATAMATTQPTTQAAGIHIGGPK